MDDELLPGITYVTEIQHKPDGVTLVESWRKIDGKIYKLVCSEDQVISFTEEKLLPFIKTPWVWPTDLPTP